MCAQIIDARVKQKTGVAADFAGYTLLEGEIALVRTSASGPVWNFKVGPGNFDSLDWSLQNPGAAQKADTSTVFPTGVPGLYIPIEDGTYEGVTVDLSVGYVQLIWDGSALVKAEFPIDLTGYATNQDVEDAIATENAPINAAVFGNMTDVTPVSWANAFVSTSGAMNSNPNYRVSGFISVIPGQQYQAALSGSASTLIVSAYSAANQANFLSGNDTNIVGSSPSGHELTVVTFTIAAGVSHIRVGYNSATTEANIYLKVKTDNGLVGEVDGLDKTSELTWSNGYIASNGTENTASSYRKSNFYPVSEGDKLAVQMSGSASVLIVSAYSSNIQESFLPESTVNVLGTSISGVGTTFVIVEIPSGVNYLRFSRANGTPIGNIFVRQAGLTDRVTGLENRGQGGSEIGDFAVIKRRLILRRKPIFSFIFDDLRTSDSLVYNVFKDYRMRPGFALQTNKFNSANTALYQEMYMDGVSIISHGTTDNNLEPSMKDSRIALEERGFVTSGWVTNSSTLDPSLLPTVKKYYGYAFTQTPVGKGVMPSAGYDESVDPCEMSRISLEVWNKDETGQAALKSVIDYAITNNLLIVFYGHQLPSSVLNTDGVTSSFTEADLRGVLEYLEDKRDNGLCEVLSPDEAIYQYYQGVIQ